MKVPYSMDESEPDLYGGMGGIRSDDDHWERECFGGDYEPRIIPKVYTQKEMDLVIQFNIKAVQEAREEGYDRGFEDGVIEGNMNCQHR